jgi:hypothetical protein
MPEPPTHGRPRRFLRLAFVVGALVAKARSRSGAGRGAQDQDASGAPERHEARDVALRPLLILAGLFVGLIVGTAALLHVAIPRDDPPPAQADRGETPDLQRDPQQGLAAFEAEQRAARDRLGWADRAAGRAHVPVAAAMDIIVREGLPPRPRAPECPDGLSVVPRGLVLVCKGGPAP